MAGLVVAGLFAGIGGLELGLRNAGHRIAFLCENDQAAQTVLHERFPEAGRIAADVRELKGRSVAPSDLWAAGFPCQDLSQAGRMGGIEAANSGLVAQVFRLLKEVDEKPEWLLLENVPFMLKLRSGEAMRVLTTMLEHHGYRWAYRVVDTRSFGLPQRRRRVVVLAARHEDPRDVLLTEDAGEPDLRQTDGVAHGFYWTEGNTGIGWAVDSIPALKKGSNLGIASPPAIWLPTGEMVTPDIRDAERLQGFPPDWTIPSAEDETFGRGARWRLVGNAVSVPVAEWVGQRLLHHGVADQEGIPINTARGWPSAGWGEDGRARAAEVSEWPCRVDRTRLADFLEYPTHALSLKASRGFLTRLKKSRLRVDACFVTALEEHVARMEQSVVS